MSRTTRILGGAGIGYVHQAATILLGLWLTPFLLRRVGQHDYGLWLVAGQLLGYLALLDLGVLNILPRDVAILSGQPDKIKAAADTAALLARVTSIMRRWLLPGLAAACALVVWLLPEDWSQLRWPLVPVLVAFVALYPLRILLAALQGVQELPLLAAAQLAGWVAGTATTIGLIFAGFGLYALVVGWIVTTGIPAGIAWRRAQQLWPRVSDARQRGADTEIFRSSLWLSAGQVAQVLMAGSDVLVIGRLLGPAAVVPYVCTSKLVSVFANHPHLLMHVAQPALSEMRTSASRDRLRDVATALTQAMLIMSGALAIAILPANQAFVTWWVGPSQYGGWPLAVALVAMMVLRHLNVAVIYTLFCFGHERRISVTSLVDGSVTLAAMAVLITAWGPIGAPLGSIIGVLTTSLPINGRATAREMQVTVAAFARTFAPLVLRIGAIGCVAAVGSIWLASSSIGVLCLLWVGCLVLYAVAVFPIAWHGPLGPHLRHALHLTRRSTSTVVAAPPVEVRQEPHAEAEA